MTPELNAGADTALADGNDSSDVLGSLEAFFIVQDSQVDNSDAEVSTEEPAAQADEAAEVAEEIDPEKDEEPKTDEEPAEIVEPPAKTPEPDAEEADFDALEPKSIEFLDAAGLKAKFPRGYSNEFLAEAAKYSEAAKKGTEVIKAIGGEAFVPGMTTIATSLKDGNYRDALGGIAETVGPEGLVHTIAETMRLGFVEADEMAASDNPYKSHFGKTMLAVVDSVIEQRFGPEMSIEKLTKLAQWEQAGWFDKIEKWAEESYVDHAELDELLETTNDPKLLELKQEKKRLEAQLAEAKPQADASTAAKRLEIENSFNELSANKVDEVMTDIVLKRSPLRDLPTDSAETKEEKALLRNQLTDDAKALLKTDPAYAKLLEGYKTGQIKTAVFQTKFAEAINKAVLGTRAKTATAERIFAKLQGSTRNSQLAKKQSNRPQIVDPQAQRYQPTVTKTYGDGEKLTGDQIFKNLQNSIAAMG